MSEASIKAFFNTLGNDAAMAERYKTLLGSQKGEGGETIVAAVVRFAAAEGYTFTEADLSGMTKAMKDQPLTDEQLEAAAGGALGWAFVAGSGGQSDFVCFTFGWAL